MPARLLCVLVLGFACLSFGCAQATTQMAGWYITRKLDQTFDLTRSQKGRVRERVDHLIELARRDELPQWIQLLRRVRDAIEQNTVESQFDALQARSDALLERAAVPIIRDLAWLLSELDAAQITHFEQEAKERLEEIYADQHIPPSERRKKLSESLRAGLEKLVGPLDDDQAESIFAVARTLPNDRTARYHEAQARLFEATRFFISRPGQGPIEAELTRLWRTRNDGGMGRAARHAAQRTLLLAVDKTLTQAQRRHAATKLSEQVRFLKRFLISET